MSFARAGSSPAFGTNLERRDSWLGFCVICRRELSGRVDGGFAVAPILASAAALCAASGAGNAGATASASAARGFVSCCAKAAKNKCFFRDCLDRVSASKYYLRSIFEAG